MTLPETLTLAQARVSKPLRKGGGYAVLRRNTLDKWIWHTCAERSEASLLVSGMRAAEAVRLANVEAGKPWRVLREEEARVRASKKHAEWRKIATEIIKRP
jgi:hypothetical protein